MLLNRTKTLPDSGYWTSVYWKNFLLVLQYYATASAASLVGIVFGAGDSASRFLDCEINGNRFVPELQGLSSGGGDGR